MTVLVGQYTGARGCTGGPTAGAKNLTSWHLAANAFRGGTNLGIYNCRPVRGGGTWSLHAEGRAADLGTPVENNWSWGVVEFLRAYSAELGIQCAIHQRKIWSSSGGLHWRPYSGPAAHFDHAHVELTRWAADGGLTVANLEICWSLYWGGQEAPVAPKPSFLPDDGILEVGDTGPSVETLQRVLNRWYPSLPPLAVDGGFGAGTKARVVYFQTRAGLTSDGIAGPITLRALGLAGLR